MSWHGVASQPKNAVKTADLDGDTDLGVLEDRVYSIFSGLKGCSSSSPGSVGVVESLPLSILEHCGYFATKSDWVTQLRD